MSHVGGECEMGFNDNPRRRELVGALEEKRFFDRIMFEHAKFVRAGVDPTEEAAFRTADRFAVTIEAFWNRVMGTPPSVSDAVLLGLIDENFALVRPLEAFMKESAQALTECRLLAITPAELIEHLALETVFFLGILSRVTGKPTPTLAELLVAASNERALLLPRRSFIDARRCLTELAFEYGMFWIRRHMEHAAVLALFFRPGIQASYIQAMNEFETRFREVLDAGRIAFAQVGVPDTVYEDRMGWPGGGAFLPGPVDSWIQQALDVTADFRGFMVTLVNQLVTCTIPGKQANFWPLLGDHIRREADYLIDALQRIRRAASGVPEPEGFPVPRPWEVDWRELEG